ncbi:MAG: hypothetical protein V1775_07550 [Bacteroidota bacterium]
MLTLVFAATKSLNARQPNLESRWVVWNNTLKPDSIRLKAIDDLIRDGYL